jgi:hypothetical protein
MNRNMELSHAYIDQRKHEIWSQPDHFFCEKLGCWQSVNGCLKRQALTKKLTDINFLVFAKVPDTIYSCVDCAQGKEIKDEWQKNKEK